VEEQDWPQIESIVVDGASTDGTAQLLADRTSRHGYSYVSEPDGGIYDAMNKGARRSTGELLIFMNAGDGFSGPGIVSLICNSYSEESWRWGYGCARTVRGRTVEQVMAFAPFRLQRLACGLAFVPHQAAVISRQLFFDLDGFDESAGLAADQELCYRAGLTAPPRVWAEFFADFEGGGVGSNGGPSDYARAMRGARRRKRNYVGGSAIADAVITAGVIAWQHLLRTQTAARKKLGIYR
jgi:glycosyltransferase involved in cell wall biosynthesis